MILTTFLAIAWIAIMIFDLVVVLHWNKRFRELYDYWVEVVLRTEEDSDNG